MPTLKHNLLRLQALILCCNLTAMPAMAAASVTPSQPAGALPGQRIRMRASSDSYEAAQAAELLGISNELARLQTLRSQGVHQNLETTKLRATIFKKILLGFIEVRRACNKIDFELAYTYNVISKQQRKQQTVNDALNVLNFTQFGTQYTLGAYSRIKKNFKTSAIYTCIGSGTGLILSTGGIIYNKTAKAHNLTPPKFMDHVLVGGPVVSDTLPPLLQGYLSTRESGSDQTRREQMHALWKARYRVDASKDATVYSLNDGKPKSLGQLNTRLLLLWSMHTYVQDFDKELLALLESAKTNRTYEAGINQDITKVGLTSGALQAARLLKIEPLIGEIALNSRAESADVHRLSLETDALQEILTGALDMRIAADQCDEEINYAYDVALSELTFKRGQGLQKNFEINFIKTGFLSGTAGLVLLNGYTKAGTELFTVNGAVGTLLATVALIQMHGGWRKRDTPPNSLADFFDLSVSQEHQFSPLASAFLNSPTSQSTTGETHKQLLKRVWKEYKVNTIDIEKKSNQEKVAAMPEAKKDSINIIRNRIRMLTSLKVELEFFDAQLYDLARFVEQRTNSANDFKIELPDSKLSKHASQMANILGVRKLAEHAGVGKTPDDAGVHVLADQIAVAGRVLLAALDIRRTADKIDLQIAKEQQTLDRMVRMRDMAVAMTNNANFYQLGICSIVQGGLGLSSNPTYNLASTRLNIVSGMMVDGFAVGALAVKRGGYRPNHPEANMLGDCFGFDVPIESKFSPEIATYFKSVPPFSNEELSRTQELIKFWKNGKVITVNVDKKTTLEKLAALKSNRFWDESIGLIRNRIIMLYDVSAVVDSMDIGLAELLEAQV